MLQQLVFISAGSRQMPVKILSWYVPCVFHASYTSTSLCDVSFWVAGLHLTTTSLKSGQFLAECPATIVLDGQAQVFGMPLYSTHDVSTRSSRKNKNFFQGTIHQSTSFLWEADCRLIFTSTLARQALCWWLPDLRLLMIFLIGKLKSKKSLTSFVEPLWTCIIIGSSLKFCSPVSGYITQLTKFVLLLQRNTEQSALFCMSKPYIETRMIPEYIVWLWTPVLTR